MTLIWLASIGGPILASGVPVRGATQPARSNLAVQIQQIGNAQVQTVVNTGFFPDDQPEVYWHDPDWKIDLLLPRPLNTGFSIVAKSRLGKSTTINLPMRCSQINSILLAPGERAVIEADDDSESGGFFIIDLRAGKVLDDVITAGAPDPSPNRRFILYGNWFQTWNDSVDHSYRLYDVAKTPRQNTCGYDADDPKHKLYTDYLRGFQVFPQTEGQQGCSISDEGDSNVGAYFTWTPDSSRVVFADFIGDTVTLVLVVMPIGVNDLPRTSIYRLTGPEDICKGAPDPAGESECDDSVIRSLAWDGDAIRLTPAFPPHRGPSLTNDLIIPISRFVPIR